ncbi:unnamed protein product [Trifolium pratense]|uniref:Uncharacterized protein n=1 Tax=Trifolium pratense TaxID=57577 RepID=A0ACB0IE27_TRIPR|nr:unnamed protein product [Trifolium pratense]
MSQQNVFDHPQQQQQFLGMSNNNTSSSSDLGGSNQNQNSENEILRSNGDHQQQKRSNKWHKQEQIQKMEVLFKESPHLNSEQVEHLSLELGLTPTQIKHWFQNKRNQAKGEQERHKNELLKDENAKLRAENEMYKEELKNATCSKCGGPTSIGERFCTYDQLKIENARLKAEIEGTHAILSKRSSMSAPAFKIGNGNHIFSSVAKELCYDGNDPFGSLWIPNDCDNPKIIELAEVSMEELTKLTLVDSPLWISTNDSEILNEDEYIRVFPNVLGPKLTRLKSESSRESVLVNMNHINLVEIIMDVNQWSTMFSCIVSNATTLKVLSPSELGNYNGAVQVMSADFQVLSPLVPARKNYFVRYCKQHQQGVWAIVDVSLDHLRPNSNATPKSRRRPSGCLIQELPNGHSKVTWVEHVEVGDNTMSPNTFYKSLITSGFAFGAKRWVALLCRQCERLAYSMTTDIPAGDHCVMNGVQGRKSLLDLAERMKVCFSTVAGSSIASCWNVLTSDSDDVRVMTRTIIGKPGTSPSIVVSAGTSLWLPVLPRRLFNFLGNQNSRSESENCYQNNMIVLQDNNIDSTSSHVIYAPIDINAMNVVFNGGDSNFLTLLPSGFVILPDGVRLSNGGPMLNAIGSGGCILTISFQALVDSSPTRRITNGFVKEFVNLIKNTIERIKVALACDRNA